MTFQLRSTAWALALGGLAACSQPVDEAPPKMRYALAGPLVPARMTMTAAWDVPWNPLTDPALNRSEQADAIRWGYRLFMNTPAEASRFVSSPVTCANCHLNAGQRERALPLVGIARVFPEDNKRAGRPFTLADRIVDCFWRSENATAKLGSDAHGETREDVSALPAPDSKEVRALAAYLTWLSRDSVTGPSLWWRGQNTIPRASLIPIDKLDPAKGEALYAEHCATCHGPDGQGVYIGDKRAAPLWGPESWNDGAGAARVYTLAGIIRYMMPYLNPGSLTDEEAQQLAAFITSKPRPSYPFKDRDYLANPVPPDAVYYPTRAPSR
jgi:thiosulfate dehydrogenase